MMSSSSSSIAFFSALCSILIEANHALLMPHPSTRHDHVASLRRRNNIDASLQWPATASSFSALFASSSSSDDALLPPRRVRIRARAGGSSMATSRTKRKSEKKKATSSLPSSERPAKNNKARRTGDEVAGSASEADAEGRPFMAGGENNNDSRSTRRKPTTYTKSGAPFQHQEMMDHAVLTREEEFTYGRQVVRARELRLQIEGLLEKRRVEREVRRMEVEEMAVEAASNEEWDSCEVDDEEGGVRGQGEEDLDYDFLSYELEYLSMYGFRPSLNIGENTDEQQLDLEDDLLIDHAQHRSRHMSQLRNSQTNEVSFQAFVGAGTGPRRNGYRNDSSSLLRSAPARSAPGDAGRNSYTSLLQIPLHELTEFDVVNVLEIPGGKAELIDVLLEGAYAREILMRRNVKLVMSIAKNWMKNSFSTSGGNFGGDLGGGGGTLGGGDSGAGKKGSYSDKSAKRHLSLMYEGSWDRPSLDEAVQEGVLGLARAVDRYDPERGLRLSTYATHWIQSHVRSCFQRAATGCLRVPSQLHDIKAAYNRIVREHISYGNSNPPAKKDVAAQLGVSERRLTTAIRATGTLLSIDAPVMSAGGSGTYKGSMAGGDGAGGQELMIMDTLKCAEPRPEDQVEISFLRQCLENAMATELTPYERDVLRLRLGLDGGAARTAREIVEMSGGSVSVMDVRSTEKRAFRKLRSPTSVHTRNLLAYLDFADMTGLC